MQENCL